MPLGCSLVDIATNLITPNPNPDPDRTPLKIMVPPPVACLFEICHMSAVICSVPRTTLRTMKVVGFACGSCCWVGEKKTTGVRGPIGPGMGVLMCKVGRTEPLFKSTEMGCLASAEKRQQ
jgi:hypothetical protein